MIARGFEWANASRVTDDLWIGGDLETTDPALALAQLDELDCAGLTDIVDLRLEWSDETWVAEEKPHLQYRWLGVDDGGQRMPDEWFDIGTDHIVARLNAGGTVLVHCHMGINRGPSMGYAAMLALGWDPIDALNAIRTARPIAYIGYAEDALDWWVRRNTEVVRNQTTPTEILRQWRLDNHLDVAGVIRGIGMKENCMTPRLSNPARRISMPEPSATMYGDLT
jgi:dual specificity phosphatase 3